MLSRNINIPYQFFEKHISSCEQRGVPNKVDWFKLSRNKNIPVTFFQKHLDKVDWFNLSGNTNIPKYYNLIKLKEILYNYKL